MLNKIRCFIKVFNSKDHAAVTLITALLLAILIGFLGLATDTSYAFYVRTKMQAAADAAALGGASNMLNGGSKSDAIGVAQSLASLNGFKDGEVFTSVTTSIPPGPNPDGSTPTYSDNSAYVRVQIAQSVKLFFAPLIGFANTWTVKANAVAGIKSSPDCLVTLSDLSINGTNIANLNNCSAVIGGNLNATNSSMIAINGSGTTSVYNNGSISCNSCTPAPLKRSGSLPTLPTVSIPSGLSVVTDANCSSGTCQPGIYNNFLQLKNGASYTFASGFYVFNKGISTNSAIVTSAPNGVTLYIAANQPIDLSGSLTLSAQATTGCSIGSGVLIYQAPSTITSMKLAGSKDLLKLDGIVDLPYVDITISGSSSNLTLYGSLIAHSLSLNGNMNPSASANPCNNFASNNKVSLVQ
jgi:uncharacterized membrane protein